MLDGKREQSQLLGVRLRSEVKIITQSALKMANSTIVTVWSGERILAIPDGETVPYLIYFNPRRTNPVTGRVAPHRGVVSQCHKVRQCFQWVTVKWWLQTQWRSRLLCGYSSWSQLHQRYMHLRKILVKPGQKVKRGAVSRFPVIPDVQPGRICTMKMDKPAGRKPADGKTAAYRRATGSDRREFLAQAKEIVPQLRLIN